MRMKSASYRLPRSVRNACCAVATTLFLLCGVHLVYAQWTESDVAHAWSGYINNYLYAAPNGYNHIATTVGGSAHDGFWQSAEEIDMVTDAYYWSLRYRPSLTTSIATVDILDLVNGFRNIYGDTWSTDNYNDDLDVAVIAFARASQVNYDNDNLPLYLTDAENAFNTVWSRAQQGNGGLCQNVSLGCYENSSVNWTFVIAGNLLYRITGNKTYLNEANSVYKWAVANLYQSSTGQIYDAAGGVTGQYSYNYGYAVGAMTFEGDSARATAATKYLMNNLTNYAGTYHGYNILPNYGQSALDNDGGFNGITLRWTYFAYAHRMFPLPGEYLRWAQANLSRAWANRDSQDLIWDDWVSPTPAASASNPVYSWDCSSALVGMFDVAAPWR